MKKTLFALLALLTLSGVSVAKTDTSAINTTDETLVSFFDFEDNNGVTAGTKTGGWENLLEQTCDEAGNYGTLSTNHYLYAENTGFGSKSGGGFTISFDLNAITLPEGSTAGVLLHMHNGNSVDNVPTYRHFGLYIDSTGKLTMHFANNDVGTAQLPLTKTTVGGNEKITYDWSTVTIVFSPLESGKSDSNWKAMLYINGGLVNESTMNGSSNWLKEHIAGIQFGKPWGENTVADHTALASAQLDNILIYDKALTADEVRKLVPEPATATLSLLALAGLAARRRRK